MVRKTGGWLGVALGIVVAGASAQEIVVSWSSNGMLRAEGMEPGATCTLEWASKLPDGFGGNPAPFEGLVADSNGVVQVQIPQFFRMSVVPDGMVRIPGGTNSGTDPDFGVYSLTVDSFYMDRCEVTKAQWDTVYDWAVTNGYTFSHAGSGKAANHPVQQVNWYDCVKWCNARSQMSGQTPCYTVDGGVYKMGESSPDCNFSASGYRLPTSIEWEYAARGGRSGLRFPWGDTITHREANYKSSTNVIYDVSSTRGSHPDYDDWGDPKTSQSKSFPANGYGVYDMAGNVREWCNTAWGVDRMVRGSDWTATAYLARCGNTFNEEPGRVGNYHGFRCVFR